MKSAEIDFIILKAKCNKHQETGAYVKAECQQACPCITELTDDPNLTKVNGEAEPESSFEDQKSESPLKEQKSGSALDTLQVKKSKFRVGKEETVLKIENDL